MNDVLLSLTKALNRVVGGKEDYTLCATMWEWKLEGSRVGRVGVVVLDTIFFQDKKHCYQSFRVAQVRALRKRG